MPQDGSLQPLAKSLDSQVNLGASTTTTFTAPKADSYKFILDSPAGAGTSPTLDVQLETSPDGGTTWYVFAKFTQITGTAKKYAVSMRPRMGVGEAPPSNAPSDITGGAAASAFAVDGPIAKDCRINYIVGGTSPQFTGTVKVWMIVQSASAIGF